MGICKKENYKKKSGNLLKRIECEATVKKKWTMLCRGETGVGSGGFIKVEKPALVMSVFNFYKMVKPSLVVPVLRIKKKGETGVGNAGFKCFKIRDVNTHYYDDFFHLRC